MARPGGGGHEALLCDTNVLVRFLTADSAELSPASRRTIELAAAGELSIFVADVVVAELAYVLTRVYGLAADDVTQRVRTLLSLPGIECSDPELMASALAIWSEANIDFADAYLAAMQRLIGRTAVLSFDADFDRIDGVERVDPRTY